MIEYRQNNKSKKVLDMSTKEHLNKFNSPVLKCDDCGELWFVDDNEDVKNPTCTRCNSHSLSCDHPGSHLDEEIGVFVCSSCGQHDSTNVAKVLSFISKYTI